MRPLAYAIVACSGSRVCQGSIAKCAREVGPDSSCCRSLVSVSVRCCKRGYKRPADLSFRRGTWHQPTVTQRLYSVSGIVSVNHSVSLSVISALVQCSTPAGIEVGVELHCLARGSQVAALHTPNRCHLQTPQLHVSGCGTPLSSSG